MISTVSPIDFSLDEVLPFAGPRAPEREYAGFRVRMESLRYQVFQKAVVCVSCGAVGSVFRLQRNDTDKNQPANRAHFNLYALVGDVWVLMTQDHILPRSKGGKDRLENLQPMCAPCNVRKGSSHPGA